MTSIKPSGVNPFLPVLVEKRYSEHQLQTAKNLAKEVVINVFRHDTSKLIPTLWRLHPRPEHLLESPDSKSYVIDTMITLDYRKRAWGMERIALDGIQNHLPGDSGGTEVYVRLKQEGEWVDLKEADPSKATEEVIFEDNGKGYDSGLLSILFSTKEDSEASVGQFGEGLKMVAAAALREGVELQYMSKNWTAKPFVKKVTAETHEVQKLCFEIVENGHSVEGSRTVFRNPPQKLLDEIFKLPENQLALNHNYRTLYSDKGISHEQPSLFPFISELLERFKNLQSIHEWPDIKPDRYEFSPSARENKKPTRLHNGFSSRILELTAAATDEKFLYVKGERKRAMKAIFSYDLNITEISPDRRDVEQEKVLDQIEHLLHHCDSEEVVTQILLTAHVDRDGYYAEFQSLDPFRKNKGILGHPYMIARDFLVDREVDSMPSLSGGSWIYLDKFKKEPKQRSVWVRTFFKLFGENAFLAAEDSNLNTDAKIIGLNPVKLNGAIHKFLVKQGVPGPREALGESEYRFVDSKELTEKESMLLAQVEEINEVILGENRSVPVKIYSGRYLKGGTKVTSDLGVQITYPDGTKIIGIKRDVLQDEDSFIETYIHELGHYVTGKGDYDREFTDFFVKALAKMTKHKLKNKSSI